MPRLALLTLMLTSCVLVRAQRNNEDLATITTLRGTLQGGASEGKPRWVVLFKKLGGKWTRYSQLVLQKEGPFEFLCLSGQYQLVAFEDQNEDWVLQPGEPSARYGASEGISLVSGQPLAGLDVTLGTLTEPLGFEVVLARSAELTDELVKVHAGDLATFADERFSPAAGQLGLWQAADFARKWGVGVSFLEAYSPSKTPVLFVHGAGGTPRDFETLAAGLDHSRFQAWVLSYPSGIRLELAGQTARQITDDLQQRLGFRTLYVVAHSMGGLVARHFVNQVTRQGAGYVSLFVTISTPWGGVVAAKGGVERSPVVLPSWIDVAEGSDFLQVLLEQPLPPSVPHHLFFGFQGGAGSDGVIALESQLDEKVQRGAASVYGFPDDHTAILKSAAVGERLNRVLLAAEPRD